MFAGCLSSGVEAGIAKLRWCDVVRGGVVVVVEDIGQTRGFVSRQARLLDVRVKSRHGERRIELVKGLEG